MLTAESSHKVRHFSGAVNYVIRAYESYRPTTTDDAPSRLRLDGQLQDPVHTHCRTIFTTPFESIIHTERSHSIRDLK